ncbi:MAG: YchJ family metal-binding protein [Anaerolineae bacterium]
MKISPNEECPCGSGKKYKKCCRTLHSGAHAPSPEALMRSRYSAYALGRIDYIMQSTHPDGPHYEADTAAWRRDLEAFSRDTRFVKLDILNAEGDTVTFHATLMVGSRDMSFTERSLFRMHDGRWTYFSGETL